MEVLHFSLKRLLERSKDLTSFKCEIVSLLVSLNSLHSYKVSQNKGIEKNINWREREIEQYKIKRLRTSIIFQYIYTSSRRT